MNFKQYSKYLAHIMYIKFFDEYVQYSLLKKISKVNLTGQYDSPYEMITIESAPLQPYHLFLWFTILIRYRFQNHFFKW